jgi:hypothetical protein
LGNANKKNYLCDLEIEYDYSKQFKEPQIIEEDEELKIVMYEKRILANALPLNIN